MTNYDCKGYHRFNALQQKTLALSPKPFALISFLCAVYFFVDIVRHEARRCKVYHRLIMAMMFCSGKYKLCHFLPATCNSCIQDC